MIYIIHTYVYKYIYIYIYIYIYGINKIYIHAWYESDAGLVGLSPHTVVFQFLKEGKKEGRIEGSKD